MNTCRFGGRLVPSRSVALLLFACPPLFSQIKEAWVSRYETTAPEDNHAAAISLDDTGNVYVTGRVATFGGLCDFLTLKLDSSGQELWRARYGGFTTRDCPVDIAVGGSGNVYVTGNTAELSNERMATVKYSAAGKEVWVRTFERRRRERA